MQYLVKEEKENKEERKYKNNILKKKKMAEERIFRCPYTSDKVERERETQRELIYLC